MKVLVCGGRNFDNRVLMYKVLNTWHHTLKFTKLIHGDARGADRMAAKWGNRNLGEDNVKAFPADWDNHHKSAGPIRNQEMLDDEPDVVIAFPGSSGTADMKKKTKKKKVRLLSVNPDGTVKIENYNRAAKLPFAK